MESPIQLSYTIFAPLSFISECILLYAFIRLKQLKDHPEIMIFWQCISQIILDVHWFTGIDSVKSSLSDFSCKFLGAFFVYFYYLSWDYTLWLSLEIYLKIVNPHKTGYKKRMIWYHSLSHLSSAIIFTMIMITNTNGNSILTTCFVEGHTILEFIVLFPVLFHFPMSIGIILYAIYISYGTFYVNYLKYHMLVVVAFSISWVPGGLAHGLNYRDFHITIPLPAIYVF
jgi:hypothetical protein